MIPASSSCGAASKKSGSSCCARLGLAATELPVLWDADFLLGGAEGADEPRHVLCEINVSSVAPYPESATSEIVAAVRDLLAIGY
jgi:hypothetical protein